MTELRHRTWGGWMQAHGWPNLPGDRPQVVTLCGSTRFAELFYELSKSMTLQGHIVLSIEVTTTQSEADDPQFASLETKEMLDLLHFEKIKMSDWIFVINKGGYIGESTAREIAYAKSIGIPIDYLESGL